MTRAECAAGGGGSGITVVLLFTEFVVMASPTEDLRMACVDIGGNEFSDRVVKLFRFGAIRFTMRSLSKLQVPRLLTNQLTWARLSRMQEKNREQLTNTLYKVGLSKIEAELLQFKIGAGEIVSEKSNPKEIDLHFCFSSGYFSLHCDLALLIIRHASRDRRLLGILTLVSHAWNAIIKFGDVGDQSLWRTHAESLGISPQLSPFSWKEITFQGNHFISAVLRTVDSFLAHVKHTGVLRVSPNSLHFSSCPGWIGGRPRPGPSGLPTSMWAVAQPFYRSPETGHGSPLARSFMRGFQSAGWSVPAPEAAKGSARDESARSRDACMRRAEDACGLVEKARLTEAQARGYLAWMFRGAFGVRHD